MVGLQEAGIASPVIKSNCFIPQRVQIFALFYRFL